MKNWLLSLIAVCLISGCFNKTPEFTQAQDAHLRTYALAAQVRGADRISQAAKVRAGERFYANCDTYSRTVADLLVSDYGADPSQVWLVQVDIPVKGFVWENQNGKWQRIKASKNQVVLYKGLVLDNRWRPVVTVKDLGFEYEFVKKMNIQDKQWVAF